MLNSREHLVYCYPFPTWEGPAHPQQVQQRVLYFVREIKFSGPHPVPTEEETQSLGTESRAPGIPDKPFTTELLP